MSQCYRTCPLAACFCTPSHYPMSLERHCARTPQLPFAPNMVTASLRTGLLLRYDPSEAPLHAYLYALPVPAAAFSEDAGFGPCDVSEMCFMEDCMCMSIPASLRGQITCAASDLLTALCTPTQDETGIPRARSYRQIRKETRHGNGQRSRLAQGGAQLCQDVAAPLAWHAAC